MGCLFCGFPENGYMPDPNIEFICSQCTQFLLLADQAELMQAYNRAIEKGHSKKAKAIEPFLIPEETNVRETQKPKRGSIRKKPMRVVRPALN